MYQIYKQSLFFFTNVNLVEPYSVCNKGTLLLCSNSSTVNNTPCHILPALWVLPQSVHSLVSVYLPATSLSPHTDSFRRLRNGEEHREEQGFIHYTPSLFSALRHSRKTKTTSYPVKLFQSSTLARRRPKW